MRSHPRRYEKELQKLYSVYLERFRNLDYLEHELEQYNRAEQEKMDEADRVLKRMQKRLREQELKMLRGAQVALPCGSSSAAVRQ
jgi:clusterin-associated protein 1